MRVNPTEARTRRRRAAWVLGLAVLVIVVGPSAPTGAQPADGPAAFAGTAEARGLRLTFQVNPAVVTDTPLDGGGPTAQVAVDSLGSSGGYAAFPDPGQGYATIPGTMAGLLATGAGGLPPIKIPTPPNYPFFVSSNASTAPEQSMGAGPYALSAQSTDGASEASARVGIASDVVGNLALVTSRASLGQGDHDSVVAKAVSRAEGLTIGPLTVGEVESSAAVAADRSGTVTPSTSLEIDAVRIGNIPVQVNQEGLYMGGPSVPLPLNATLQEVLKASGISVQLVAARQPTPGTVVAPALEITMPFTSPELGEGKSSGTVTIVAGSATASMTGVAAGADVRQPELFSGDAPGSPPPTAAPTTGGSQRPDPAMIPSFGIPPGRASGTAATGAVAAAQGPDGIDVIPSHPERERRPLAKVRTVDLRSSFVPVLGGALLLASVIPLGRRLGVRP